MKKVKSLVMVCSMVMVLASTNTVFAKEMPAKAVGNEQKVITKVNKDTERIITNKNEILKYAKERNLESPEKIKEIRIIDKEVKNDPMNYMKNDDSRSYGGYKIERYGNPVVMEGTIPYVSYTQDGPSTYSRTVTVTVTSEISGNCGINAEIVSANVGAKWVSSYSDAVTNSVTIPSGASWTFNYYPKWMRYYFKITQNGSTSYGRLDIACGSHMEIVKR